MYSICEKLTQIRLIFLLRSKTEITVQVCNCYFSKTNAMLSQYYATKDFTAVLCLKRSGIRVGSATSKTHHIFSTDFQQLVPASKFRFYNVQCIAKSVNIIGTGCSSDYRLKLGKQFVTNPTMQTMIASPDYPQSSRPIPTTVIFIPSTSHNTENYSCLKVHLSSAFTSKLRSVSTFV